MSLTVANASPAEKYKAAGQITREIKKQIDSRDWRGKTYAEICEFVEGEIRSKGAAPAFPVNVCANDSAAHYTAEIDDPRKVSENALLKVDIGAHIDGYVADTAVTLCYNEDLIEMAEATKGALGEALKEVKNGGKTSDVGRVVENYAARRGYLPIENLSGHQLDYYQVHAGASVPNVWAPSLATFKLGNFYAVEPFFTTRDGAGVVAEGKTRNIFSLVARKRTKDKKLDDFVELIWSTCRTLPFPARWFKEYYKKSELDSNIAQLLKARILRSYPELLEAKGQPVAQAEHTVGILPEGVVVLT